MAAPGDKPRHVIGVRAFSKSYGKHVAVQSVTLSVAPGQIYGLIGADGAGKSSLMKAIAGVLTYDEGEIEVFGQAIDSEKNAEKVKDKVGFMPQGLGLNLYPTLSIDENIDFFARLRMVPAALLHERKERLLQITRLAAFRDRAARNLSGGMKQKLGLVCTLIHSPKLIILDEPTTGVDPVSRRDFWMILAQLIHTERLTALISTAYLDEASRFDRLALMHLGEVMAEGTPEELTDAAPASIVQLTPPPALVPALAQAYPQHDNVHGQLRLYVPTGDEAEAQHQVLAVLAAQGLTDPPPVTVSRPVLEDVFMARLWADEDTAPGALQAVTPPPVPDGEWAMHAEALTRDFGAFRAVDQVSFKVQYGEIFGLLGANGAGKTTAIKMLTGITPPTSGIGRVAGSDMRHARQAIKERIGYMSQAFSLYTDLTVVENLMLFAGIYGLTKPMAKARTQWAIDLGGLHGHENVPAISLPMGLRQRLALGCALIHKPRVLFLDEPTSGVDSVGRRRFWDMLRVLARQEGVAILLTTHYMAEADLCDRVALMFAGRVVADATPAQMKADLQAQEGHLLEIATSHPVAALDTLRNEGFPGAVLHGRRVHVMTHDPDADKPRIALALIRAGMQPPRIQPQSLTMEDVFIHQVLSLEAASQNTTPGGTP